MRRTRVDSSLVASVGYDKKTETLEIEFANRTVYQYLEVPEVEYRDFLNAKSIGAYFNHNIRDYGHVRIR